MRLVDGEQRDRAAVQQRGGRLDAQPLRGQVEQVEFAGDERALDRGGARSASWVELRNAARTPTRFSASTWSCISAISGEIDDAGARAHQRGDLVAQRLAAAGGHQHEGVAAAHDVVDDLGLLAAEVVVAEDAVEHVEGRGHASTV